MPGFMRLAGTAFRAWQDDRIPPLGAALAYYTLFAMGPVLIVIVAIAGTIFGPAAARGEVVGQIDQLIGASGAEVVETVLARAGPGQGSVAVTIIGVVAIILTASGAFLHLRHAMNTIWRVPRPRPQKRGILGAIAAFAVRRLRAFALVVPLGLVLMISLAVSAALRIVSAHVPQPQLVSELLNRGLSLGVLTLAFGVIYRFLADIRLRGREVWIGAIITALLFSVGNELLTQYLVRSATASVFGAASSVVILLIWVYYSAQITLYGAEYSWVFFRTRQWRRAHVAVAISRSAQSR